MSVFGPVRALDVRSLAGPVVDVEVPAGTELVREGIPIGTFFVIRSGSAELFRDGHHVRTLRTGDCFGEIDPDGDQPQAYAVTTSAPTRLLTFSAFGISRLCEAIPGVRERITAALPGAGGEVHSLTEASARSRGPGAAAGRGPAAPRT
jgi:CRP-like cAMP-binding protein